MFRQPFRDAFDDSVACLSSIFAHILFRNSRARPPPFAAAPSSLSTLGQHGRHHHVIGSENGAHLPCDYDVPVNFGLKLSGAVFDRTAAPTLHNLQVQSIAVSDDSRRLEPLLLCTGPQGPIRTPRAHLRTIRKARLIRFSAGTVTAAALPLRAEMHQDLEHVIRVAQIRDAMEDARFAREQTGGDDRERGIFRTADLDRAGKGMAAVNEDFIHTWQTGIVGFLHNRFSTRCRGNFFA